MSNPHIKLIENKRRQWRKDHPFGFVAHPIKLKNGTLNLFIWHCVIPGPRGSIWSIGNYELNVQFPSDYSQRIFIQFVPAVFHPNVNRSSRISSHISSKWPAVSIEKILFSVQNLLSNPNVNVPKNPLAALLYQNDFEEYARRVRMDVLTKHKVQIIY